MTVHDDSQVSSRTFWSVSTTVTTWWSAVLHYKVKFHNTARLLVRRLTRWSVTLWARIIVQVIAALTLGIGSNYFATFTFKKDANGVDRFYLENIEPYLKEIGWMFLDVERLWVSVNSVVIYVLVMVFYSRMADVLVLQPLRKKTRHYQQLGLGVRLRKAPIRLFYRFVESLDRLIKAWPIYLVYIAHQPLNPVSWYEFLDSVWFPVEALLDPESRLGFIIILMFISLAIWAATFIGGPILHTLKLVGKLIDEEHPKRFADGHVLPPQVKLVPYNDPVIQDPEIWWQRNSLVRWWRQINWRFWHLPSEVEDSRSSHDYQLQFSLFESLDGEVPVGHQFELFVEVPQKLA